MNQSRKALFGCADDIDLQRELSMSSSGFAILTQSEADLKSAVHRIKNPGFSNFQIANLKELNGLFKCRLIYSSEIEKIEFTPYSIPSIKLLKVVFDDQIEYSHKYLDRSHLDQLYGKKGKYDDILIVKDGLITDTWFANILFYDGNDWLTPLSPLLKGTQRTSLLKTGRIKTADIRPVDLKHFQKARLINAMIRLEDEVDIEITAIH